MRGIVLCAMVLSGCAETPEDLLARLTQPGPYGVGYREQTVTYPQPDGGGDRTLRLGVWYPTMDPSGVEMKYLDLFPAPGVWVDANPVELPLPLVVYSHGHQGYAEASGFLMAFFASHGWLVGAPDHTGNTTFDGSDRQTSIYYQRAWDMSAVIDHLSADGPTETNGSVLAMGHSFGGYTLHGLAGGQYDVDALGEKCADPESSSPICSEWAPQAAGLFEQGFLDVEVDGFLTMAAGDYSLFGKEGLQAIEAPVLMMDGTLDPATGQDADAIWSGLEGRGNRRVQITGGGHLTFTDVSGTLENFEGLIPAEEGFTIVQAYSLAFGLELLGDKRAGELLDGAVPVSDAVRLFP